MNNLLLIYKLSTLAHIDMAMLRIRDTSALKVVEV